MEKTKTAHIPKRMCAGCRSMIDKPDLIRIVIRDNALVIDKEHKILSRGIYLCKNEKCILTAQKRIALSRVFKNQVSDDFYKELIDYAAG